MKESPVKKPKKSTTDASKFYSFLGGIRKRKQEEEKVEWKVEMEQEKLEEEESKELLT